jgi:hypothetical protein
MTKFSVVWLALWICCLGATAEPVVDAKVKAQAQGFLKRMAEIEKKAAAIEPMHIPLKNRTPAQDKEMVRRIEFLDNLNITEVGPLVKEVNRAQLPGPLNPVRESADALSIWTETKLSLQNAGVNNPGLETLKKREPVEHKAFLDAFKKAQAAVK